MSTVTNNIKEQFLPFSCAVIHRMEVKFGKPPNIPKFNEAMAIDLGASFLGE